MNYYVANLNLLSLVSLAATLYLLCVYCVGIAYEKLNRAQAPVIAKARKLALAWWIPHACVLVMLALPFATTPAHVIDLLLRAVLLTWLFHLNVCRASGGFPALTQNPVIATWSESFLALTAAGSLACFIMPVPGDGKLDGNIPARVVLWLFLLVVLSALLFLRNKPTRAWTRKALYNLRYNARQVRHLAHASA